MRIGKWKLFWAAPAIAEQLGKFEQVKAEVKAIDPARMAEILPTTGKWVLDWQAILNRVKK
jgi:hypothetical protein